MSDLTVWQLLAFQFYFAFWQLIALSVVKHSYIDRLKQAWPRWYASTGIYWGGTMISHFLWALGSYFVWASEDPTTLISPATWDSSNVFIILCFVVALPIVYMISTLLFWRYRGLLSGTIFFLILFLLNVTVMVFAIIRDMSLLTIVLLSLPILWLLVVIVAGFLIVWCHGATGPDYIACDDMYNSDDYHSTLPESIPSGNRMGSNSISRVQSQPLSHGTNKFLASVHGQKQL